MRGLGSCERGSRGGYSPQFAGRKRYTRRFVTGGVPPDRRDLRGVVPRRFGQLLDRSRRDLLHKLRRYGDRDGGRPFALDSLDAYRANQLADDVGGEAGACQAGPESGGLAHRADEAEPCGIVAFQERVTQSEVERVAVRHHYEVGAYGRFGDGGNAVGVVEDVDSGGGCGERGRKQVGARIDPREAKRQFRENPRQCLADVAGSVEPDGGIFVVEALDESEVAGGVTSQDRMRAVARCVKETIGRLV